MLKYILIFLLIVSCNSSQKQSITMTNVNKHISDVTNDTVINYFIDGISTEGVEAKVNYHGGRIVNSTINICGETGQSVIVYEFGVSKIKVVETKYNYISVIDDVKSKSEMQLCFKISYFIDLEGNLITPARSDRTDIFKEFKEVVPFVL